jgi:hypothetical protein
MVTTILVVTHVFVILSSKGWGCAQIFLIFPLNSTFNGQFKAVSRWEGGGEGLCQIICQNERYTYDGFGDIGDCGGTALGIVVTVVTE